MSNSYGNALASLLQGASNGAASNVSAPVDTIAALLRRAGVPVPSNNILGEEWMRQQGLVVKPQNRLAGKIGEGFGLSMPIVGSGVRGIMGRMK